MLAPHHDFGTADHTEGVVLIVNEITACLKYLIRGIVMPCIHLAARLNDLLRFGEFFQSYVVVSDVRRQDIYLRQKLIRNPVIHFTDSLNTNDVSSGCFHGKNTCSKRDTQENDTYNAKRLIRFWQFAGVQMTIADIIYPGRIRSGR